MLEVEYRGKLGNKLFQYCLGRIIAERLGFKFKAKPIEGFINTKEPVNGKDYSSYPEEVFDGHEIDIEAIVKNKSKRKILLKGFFQKYRYYKDYKNLIRKQWLKLPNDLNVNITERDIVVVVRQGVDYIIRDSCLPFSFFEEALSKAVYDRVFLCTDNAESSFIRKFKKYNVVIRKTDTIDNFKFIMLFNKIIESQSSFCWWTSFLSNASEIYSPIPLEGFWAERNPRWPGIELKVPDEKRYQYIKCTEKYSSTLGAKLQKIKYWKDYFLFKQYYLTHKRYE